MNNPLVGSLYQERGGKQDSAPKRAMLNFPACSLSQRNELTINVRDARNARHVA